MKLTNNNIGTLEPTHDKVLFVDKQSAKQRDMTRAVGRTDGLTLHLSTDPLGTKFGALLKAGYEINAERLGDNWYVVSPDSMNESVGKAVGKSVGKAVKKKAGEELNKAQTRPHKQTEHKEHLEFVEHKDFNHDSFFDLVVSDKGLKHVHRVGIVNPEDSTYTLRDDIDLGDFEIDLDDLDDPEADVKEARVVLDSLTVKALRRLMDKLKEEDEIPDEDEAQTSPAIDESEDDAIQAQNLASVKKLLGALRVDKRNGTVKQETVDKLSELIDELEQAEPPAEGLGELIDEFASLTSKETIEECMTRNGLSAESVPVMSDNDIIMAALHRTRPRYV